MWFGRSSTTGSARRRATAGIRTERGGSARTRRSTRSVWRASAHSAQARPKASWKTAEGSLPLVLLLDQLPRNIHRGRPEAFAADEKARAVARSAIHRGFDHELAKWPRLFLYLPFEHSENVADQDLAVELVGALGNEEQTIWARRHRDVVACFGRFSHRNAILGRPSTPEEEEQFWTKPTRPFERAGWPAA
jgi:uncharacterized protein (DUF924 family)